MTDEIKTTRSIEVSVQLRAEGLPLGELGRFVEKCRGARFADDTLVKLRKAETHFGYELHAQFAGVELPGETPAEAYAKVIQSWANVAATATQQPAYRIPEEPSKPERKFDILTDRGRPEPTTYCPRCPRGGRFCSRCIAAAEALNGERKRVEELKRDLDAVQAEKNQMFTAKELERAIRAALVEHTDARDAARQTTKTYGCKAKFCGYSVQCTPCGTPLEFRDRQRWQFPTISHPDREHLCPRHSGKQPR